MTYHRYWMGLLLGAMLLLNGCTTHVANSNHISRAKPSSFEFLNSHKAALHDFEQGRLMEARAKIMAMNKNRDDYKAARRLLVRKIDPARRKMLQFYLDRARAREKHAKWRLAARDFGQAAYFSIKPKQWQRQQQRLEIKIRQRRFDVLRRALQREDQQMMARPRAFAPPKGLDNDEILKQWQQARWDAIDERVQSNYREASRQLRNGFPELAHGYLESMLRLSPGDGRGTRLMIEAKKKIPSAISLTPIRTKNSTRKRKARSRFKQVTVQSAKQIRKLMANKKWAQARQYALAWKRQHGQDADALLAAQAKQAARLFNQGRQAVKEEHLSSAVSLWQQAVTLTPNNKEYSKALEWAQQMQERLQLLRTNGTTDKKKKAKKHDKT